RERTVSGPIHHDSGELEAHSSGGIGSNRGKSVLTPHPVLLLVLALFLCGLPILPDAALYHSDERYYTDASIRMVQGGDWTTPYYLGEPRLKKPMLAYWTMAASEEALGASLLAARLPSLLLGCLLVWITWSTALAMFEDRAIALA